MTPLIAGEQRNGLLAMACLLLPLATNRQLAALPVHETLSNPEKTLPGYRKMIQLGTARNAARGDEPVPRILGIVCTIGEFTL
ncbi:MAG: hypothetical protein ACXIU5_05410 [Halomonadaceae bacterium]